MKKRIPLECAAIKVCDQASVPPLIFQLPPEQGREILETMQETPVYKYPATISKTCYNTGEYGEIPVYFVAPPCTDEIRSIIFYIHGAGWVFGSFHTHEKLVRELSARTNSLVIFPEYSRSPEVHYPVAIEQCYHVLCSLPSLVLPSFPTIDMNTLTVAGDSVGGNMAIAMTLMSKYRHGIPIHKQLLFYPVTNACFQTESYLQFAVNYYLYRQGMMWFWQQYAPSKAMQNMVLSSVLRTPIDELCGLPQALIINGEADVLRDEGESYAKHLRMAQVDVTAVRIEGIIHDFVMLNALDQTNACRTAMNVSTNWINSRNQTC